MSRYIQPLTYGNLHNFIYTHLCRAEFEILTILKPKVSGSSNVVVKHVTARDTWGEGFYVGGDSISNNITLCSITADNNRRNGLSNVYADNVIVKNSLFKNQNGTAPQDGLDVEPNSGTSVSNVQISGSQFIGNKVHGLELIAMSGPVTGVTITNNDFSGNAGSGTYFYSGVKIQYLVETLGFRS